MAYPLRLDGWNGNFCPLYRTFFLPLSPSLSRLVLYRLFGEHRRIISPWSRRIGGGLRVACPLSRCIQMMNYKYRSVSGGREGERDRRCKGSLENYSRHAARKKRIYEWDVPSHWYAGAAGWSQPWFRASLIECSTLPLGKRRRDRSGSTKILYYHYRIIIKFRQLVNNND